ncbi:Fic family protein [Dyella acidisoli]|uniref:Protein adenylyltransferase n=1 Tax=Dyella acidisoli TaxID=1867834 RepID=A0ABQ5XP28_9GAMM|nr:Fic/DOC family N-terminal domain-containing protein [Dyella acidisoli]GLQ93485.1 cell filamentation protein Fic [Dyella acidisoli]
MKPWIPDALPLSVLDASRLITPLGQAIAALSQYDGLLKGMVNAEVMLSPLTTQEAVLSSRIEGTQATVGDVLESDAGEQFDDAKNDDVEEVLNYRTALRRASREVEERPISLQLIRSLHSVLMDGVRGQDKQPGSFRTEQNWIGPKGCSIDQANFVPPNPMILIEHLEAFEKYIAGDDMDPLIQAAVVHAQFEVIHPFIDGNGRIGRLLIPLFLYCKKRIHAPMFYLSGYLESHRDEYYARLRAVTDRGEWNEWVIFFLRAVTEQANKNIEAASGIYKLYEEMKVAVRDATHSQHSALIVDTIFASPIFRIAGLQNSAEIPAASAHKVVQQLVEAKIVRCIRPGKGRRPGLYVFPRLLNIVEGRDIF